jgi:purine-binding chemotaxis protein CheW
MKSPAQENFAETDLTDYANSWIFEEQSPQITGEKFIVFYLDDELYAVSAAQVAEVVRMPDVCPLPNTPAWLLGIANLRGEIISVVDLSKLWDRQQRQNSSKPKLIVLRGENSKSSVAVTVDKLSEIITLPSDAIRFCEETSFHIFGKAFHKSTDLNLLDAKKLVSSLELH